MSEVHVPFLFPYLRAALKILYSLPEESYSSSQQNYNSIFPTEKEAHAFLLTFQSRNIRRLLRSKEQRRRDQSHVNSPSQEKSAVNDESENNELLDQLRQDTGGDMNQERWKQGSTWLTCIYLLCSPNQMFIHTSEKMFAVQTILHRLRRMDLKDAVDIEVESSELMSLSSSALSSGQDNFLTQKQFCDSFIPFCIAWMQQSHIFLHQITTQLNLLELQSCQSNYTEDYIKGQINASLLPGLSILSVFTLPSNDKYLNPIISALGAAHSTLIIRFKYSSDFLNKTPPCRVAIPLITLVRDSIQFSARLGVAHIHNEQNIQREYEYNFMIAKIVCVALANLPETIFSSAMSITRGRFSIDPSCIQLGAQELRLNFSSSPTNSETGIHLYREVLQECLNNVISSTQENQFFALSIHKAIFIAAERWASYLPISQQFFLWIHPILTAHLQHSNCNEVNENKALRDSCRKQGFLFLTALLDAANLTPDQIIASTLGLVDISNNNNSSTAKSESTRNKFAMSHLMKTSKNGGSKNTSRSKQRRKERLNNAVTKSPYLIQHAMQEHHERKEMACYASHLLFQDLKYNLKSELQKLEKECEMENMVDGEGIIGCVSSCAKACLPHLISTIFQKPTKLSKKNNMNLHMIVSSEETEVKIYSEEEKQERMGIFGSIMSFCFEICGCVCNRGVRMFSYEILMELHLAILDIDIDDFNSAYSEMIRGYYNVVVDNLYQCVMALATSCAYPADYFKDMSLDSDEEIENERNDVRDLIRCVTTIPDGSRNVFDMLQHSSIKIIERLINACYMAIKGATGQGTLLPLAPETVVHALSSLAKPLLMLTLRVNIYGEIAVRTVSMAIEALGIVCHQLLDIFKSQSSNADIAVVFPVSRLTCIAIASFAKTFASVVEITSLNDNGENNSGVDNVDKASMKSLLSLLDFTLDVAMQSSFHSIKHIPELIAVSSLDYSVYDIRGAMRGPGGEDHVGCLAIKRVIKENEKLGFHVLCSYGTFVPVGQERNNDNMTSAFTFISLLSQLLEKLKQNEISRGRTNEHGQGVTPKSRRIMITAVSQLGVISLKFFAGNAYPLPATTKFHQSVSSTMQALFYSPLRNIISLSNNLDSVNELVAMNQVCECVFDLAAFAPEMTRSLFDPDTHSRDPSVLRGVQLMIDFLVSSYDKLLSRPLTVSATSPEPDELCVQWGRLRCAILSLFRACASPNLPTLAGVAMNTITQIECETASRQCTLGPNALSSIFHDNVIGDEMLSAGAFIMLLSEQLKNVYSFRKKKEEHEIVALLQESIMCLHQSRDVIFSTIMILESEPGKGCYADPRPTITEAWYLSMSSLVSFFYGENCPAPSLVSNTNINELLSDSCSVAILLLLFKRIGKANGKRTSSSNEGMNLDGPHTLAILQFIETILRTGLPRQILNDVGLKLSSKLPHLCLDIQPTTYVNVYEKMQRSMNISEIQKFHIGGASIAAALLRATSGGLPPWAVEGIPKLFSSLFVALGEDRNDFLFVMACSLELGIGSVGFGGVDAGTKLGGKFVGNLGDRAKGTYLAKVEEAGALNNGNGWRKLKVASKAICGGKKKQSGFNLKPSMTCWECDRV